MGNCVSLSLPLDQTVREVSQWLSEKRSYIHNLKKNFGALEITMEELKVKHDDLLRRLIREEYRGLQRLAEFQVWLTRVVTIETIVNDLLSGRTAQIQRLCLCGICSKSLRSSYSYGKSVVLTLKEVEKLKSQVFEVIAEQVITFEVDERQLPLTIVGQDSMFDKAWKHLMKGVGIMGMYGMGGVGKTTVLIQMNNKFSNNKYGFDFVIWLVVSKELHVEKIQDEIAAEVGLVVEEWKQKDKSQKSNILYNFLKKKRFVLFLDDIWEKVELAEIGIPFPTRQNKCKVVFTTGDQDVSARMGVEDPMEVQCLEENEAYDLFQKKVGQITLGSDPEIPNLARIVAKKCCGLPLALNVIGETMSCKKSIHEWHHAIYVLNSYAAEFCGMEDKVLPLFKYSYDNIKGKQVKSRFLYCSLFPEDDRIPKEKLIEYWICEGMIDGSEDIEKAENKGYEIIGSLVRASLLMEWIGLDDIEMVYMHDVVREMALWIASDLGIQKEAFLVRAGVGVDRMPNVKNWSVVRRMSLMNNKIHHLVDSPKCKQLTTLFLQRTELEDISSEFFKFMPKLVVLDLSCNHKLSKFLDGISKLVSLQYLNLSGTAITHLPKDLQELKKLIHLDLERTYKLLCIAGISSLHNLKVLKLEGSRLTWDLNTVKELETLKHLELITTTINQSQGYTSHRLMQCTRYLKISDSIFRGSPGSSGSSGISLPLYMYKLRIFEITHSSISEIKMGTSFLSLVKLTIENCEYLKELTFLMLARNLKYLFVGMANQLEDIINKEKACEGGESEVVPFPKLVYLCLAGLPELKSIYWSPLPFECLKIIEVSYCPNLKTLPLDSTSGKHELVIRYRRKEWITSLEWEDEDTKTRFLASCEQKQESQGAKWNLIIP